MRYSFGARLATIFSSVDRYAKDPNKAGGEVRRRSIDGLQQIVVLKGRKGSL